MYVLLFNFMLGSIFLSFVLYLLSYITIHGSNSWGGGGGVGVGAGGV